jgi:PAS domain S-box-containing protein
MLDTMERNITDASSGLDSLNQSRLEMLIKQSLVAILTSLGVSLLILPVLWSEVPQDYLLLFAVYQLFIGISRLILLEWMKRSLVEDSSLPSVLVLRYERYFALGSFFAGLGFGGLSLLLVLDLSLLAQFMIPFVIAGVTAGAIAANVSSVLNYIAFISPASLFLVVSLALSSLFIPALLVFVYFLLMIVLIRRVNSIFVESLNLKEHNVDLVGSLTEHNHKLEHLLMKLNDSERLSSNAFNKAGVTMMLVDKDLQIFKVNDEACMLLGYTEPQLTSLGLLNLSYANEKAGNHRLFLDLVSGKKQQYHSRKRYVRIDQVDIWVQETVSAVLNEEDEFDYAIVHAQDVTEEYRLTRKLSYQANHDVITGLHNRYAFESRMQQLFIGEINDGQTMPIQHVLCYIDLDQFKVVNDTFGHTVGDTLLRELATIFKKHVRKSDMLSRIGGDEFALLMYDCSIDAAKKTAQFFIRTLA